MRVSGEIGLGSSYWSNDHFAVYVVSVPGTNKWLGHDLVLPLGVTARGRAGMGWEIKLVLGPRHP